MRSRSTALPLLTRRRLLERGAQTFGALGLGLFGDAVAAPVARAAGADDFGPLLPANGIGLMLPAGFASRIVATSGVSVGGPSGYVWHSDPDGGATFATGDGGWIYVSNSEANASAGGVGALRFASDGSLVDGYSILSGTNHNCAGGPTPWGTWLSCEELKNGRVYECNPFSPGSQGVLRPGLGTFFHEAAAVDPVHGHVYLTEDKSDGLLYRFTSNAWPDLSAGTLEAAEILDPLAQGPIAPGQVRGLDWHPVPDPNPSDGGVQSASHLPLVERATRYQVPDATAFEGGEGCWYEAGIVYFSTKFDDRVWRLDTNANQISILYDRDTSSMPELGGVDNVTVSPTGDVYVAEDGDDLQIVALTPSGAVKPIVQLTGVSGTEITGPALSPDGTRLYFSSQRNPGTTYEVTGPFAPTSQVPALGSAGRGLLLGALVAAGVQRLRTRRTG